MTLAATPKNPIPLGAQTGYLELGKKLRLRYASWQSALKERRGTVCIFPGRCEYIEKYFEVVSELRRRGFAVAVLDWRGQGGSSRLTRSQLKGHVRSFDDYEEDLLHFMKGVVLPDCPTPYFALGHSMAGAVLLRAATKRGNWFSRMVLTTPMVEILNLPYSQKRTAGIASTCCMLGLGKRAVGPRKGPWLSREFEGNLLTSDRERFVRNLSVLDTAPNLAIGAPTIGWTSAALAATAEIRTDAFPPRVRIPTLMLAAGEDEIVSSKAIEALASRLRAGTQLVLRGSRHEIMQERDLVREQFWAAFEAFIPGATMSIAS